MESMRRLNFGHHKHAEFAAHVHILDLLNVPLVEGECRIKWRFQGGMSLNTTNNDKVMGQALQTSISYLKDLRSAAAGIPNDDKGIGGDDENDGNSPNGDADHSLGGRFKGAISHASRTLRASTLSHGSGDLLSPRRRSVSMPRSNNNDVQQNPTTPAVERDHPTRKVTPSADYFRQGEGESPEASSKPTRAPGNHTFFGGTTSASPPSSPKASVLANNLLSPTSTVRPHGSPRESNALLSPVTPPARPRQAPSASYISSYNTLSRTNTALPNATDDLNGHPVIRSPSSLVESLQKANMPSKAEIKGKTPFIPLMDNQVRIDKHMVCAVAIPMQKHSKHLESSTVKLKVMYKVRTTPLPEKIGSRPAPVVVPDDSTPGSASLAVRNHKTRINGSSVSISTPVHSGVPTVHINAREVHEEICLGELLINLSEFVSVDYASDQIRRADAGTGKETWITRRYLLQNGRTNALLRVAVKMDWISGIRDFTAPPLLKGQIISPKKQTSRGAFARNRDKIKDKEKSSLYSAPSSNSSRFYLQRDDASSRSVISSECDNSLRPLSLRNALTGRAVSSKVSPESMNDTVSMSGHGQPRGLHGALPEHHQRHHLESQLSGGFEFGLDDEQRDIDIIKAIFAKPETPPTSPQLTPEETRQQYLAEHAHSGQGSSKHDRSSHSNTHTSESLEHTRHYSPAQALAFLHRSKDRNLKSKQASVAHLGVDDQKGRKRVSSMPSKSIFPPLRNSSRASTPVSIAADHITSGSSSTHGRAQGHHSHYDRHQDVLGPVLVHIPTRQEPIDIHSHPFRRKGKSTPGMPVPNTLSALGVEGAERAHVTEPNIHRDASADVAALQPSPLDAGSQGGEMPKRGATTSATGHIFKMPFKKRSSSALSRTASLQSAAPIVEANASFATMAKGDDNTRDVARTASSDVPRGSLDLQRTLRPSSEGDPKRMTLRRTTSPAAMTPAEEADLRKYIEDSLNAKGNMIDPSLEPARGPEDGNESTEVTPPSGQGATGRRQSTSQLQNELKLVSGRNDEVQYLSGSESEDDIEQSDLVRQTTNEEALDERARRLRERGLLPTLNITISDEQPAKYPSLSIDASDRR